MNKLTEHEMLVTLANMALKMDDLTGHDIVEALGAHGYGGVVTAARGCGMPAATPRASISIQEGATALVDRILSEQDREKQIKDTLSIFREVQKVAIHEAAICFKLGGVSALYRLFGHHGLHVDP